MNDVWGHSNFVSIETISPDGRLMTSANSHPKLLIEINGAIAHSHPLLARPLALSTLSEIAPVAEGLEILQGRFTTLAPWRNVVNV